MSVSSSFRQAWPGLRRGARLACLGLFVCALLAATPVSSAQHEQGQAANTSAVEPRGSLETPPSPAPSTTFSKLSGQNPNTSTAPDANVFSWSGYFYAIGALCLILGALWAALWLMRRSGKFRFMPSYNTFPRDALRIETQISLGPRRGLMVVRFLNKRLLLGLSEQQIQLLSEADYNEQPSADFSKVLEAAERQETDK